MKIGIFSPPRNLFAAQLHKACVAFNADVELFSLEFCIADEVVLTDSSISWGDKELTSFDKVIVIGCDYEDPVLPPAIDDVDWSLWQDTYLIAQQRFSFLFSLFSELSRRGVKVYNPPRVSISNFAKYDLLCRLKQSGLHVPALICSNNMDAISAFCERYETVVWRPATGRAAWQLFLDKQRLHLIAPDKPPIIVAEIIKGSYTRSYIIDGKGLMYLEHATPEISPVEELDGFICVDDVLHDDFASLADTVFNLFDMRWAQVGFARSEQGLVVYDVDTNPVVGQLPEVIQRYLVERMAIALAELPDTESQMAMPEGICRRATLFTRRMLDVLWDFERSKYPQQDNSI